MIRLEHAPRWPGWPVWAVVVVAVWAMMVTALFAADRVRGTTTPTCLFRNATGIPCPACGGTRAAFAFATGDPLGAFRLNPLVAALMLVAPVWAATRLGAGRGLVVAFGARGRAACWGGAAMVLIANWVYVWARGSP